MQEVIGIEEEEGEVRRGDWGREGVGGFMKWCRGKS